VHREAAPAIESDDGKIFCCNGCKVVYELLRENDLCDYYTISPNPGLSPGAPSRFEYLDDESIQKKLLDFQSGTVCAATFSLPQIHCSSCIWLLENLYRLDTGVVSSRADFLKKKLTVQYHPAETSLRAIVELLASLGYPPDLTLGETGRRTQQASIERSLYYKIGIAGFCFGNIMMLSFPEYLSIGDVEAELRRTFSYVNLLLALPVVFYCASGYFLSAWRGLAKRTITIDVPIALGIAVVFARSLAEILVRGGGGFLDSLSGLVFFLLLGKLFQNKTYDRLNFERNYASYFPIAITVIKDGVESSVPLDTLQAGDKILVRNGEIIPADAYVLNGAAAIDYSFVTGESQVIEKQAGDLVYAGGRQSGSIIELQTAKDVSQSYLTQLWNADAYTEKHTTRMAAITEAVGKYFTIVVLLIAAATGCAWWAIDPSRALTAVTSILIIACPCALALSSPFALGTAMRIFGRNKCYVKNTTVIESLASIDAIVFDKTGTLTHSDASSVHFAGGRLSSLEESAVRSITFQSMHPMSRMVCASLEGAGRMDVTAYRETPGEGIEGTTGGVTVRLGSRAYVGGTVDPHASPAESRTYVAVNGEIKGYFAVGARYRQGISRMLDALGKHFSLSLLSGDNDSERQALAAHYGGFAALHFFQSPMDKLQYVQSLQSERRTVAMVGDGLNDAGALRQSHVGIAVTDDAGVFSPACDAILEASMLTKLPELLSFSRASIRIVFLSFALSFLYNIVGFSFAIMGSLSPMIAAILMPLSSITVVLVATLATRYAAYARGLL
jgi:Cu+-exporting ATPase